MSTTLPAPADVRIRPLDDADLGLVVPANNAEIPAVSALENDGLTRIVDRSESALVAEVADELAGFVLALPAGLDEVGENYAWFEERLDDFTYIDRIVVLPGAQGLGVGRSLYDRVVDSSDAPVLVSEVNTNPRNDASLAFHASYGFQRIGRMTYGEDDIECAKLAKPLG